MSTKQNKSKVQKPLQLCKPQKEEGWFDGEKIVPFSEMSNTYLQNAFRRCRKKVLYYHNRMGVFDELSEKLEAEAARRNMVLLEPDNEFEKNNKRLKHA